MRILVFEDNLIWSSRLLKTLKALGHEPVMSSAVPGAAEDFQAAIVNLGSPKIETSALIPKLKSLGIHVIGHAGHKEKELLEFGRDAGCDTLATNSELTFKIESLLSKV